MPALRDHPLYARAREAVLLDRFATAYLRAFPPPAPVSECSRRVLRDNLGRVLALLRADTDLRAAIAPTEDAARAFDHFRAFLDWLSAAHGIALTRGIDQGAGPGLEALYADWKAGAAHAPDLS